MIFLYSLCLILLVTFTTKVFEELDVWLGKENKIQLLPNEDYYLTIPKRKKKTIKATIEYEGPIEAPIKKGDIIGKLNVYVLGDLEKQVDILAFEDINRSNVFSRIFKSLNYLVWGDV